MRALSRLRGLQHGGLLLRLQRTGGLTELSLRLRGLQRACGVLRLRGLDCLRRCEAELLLRLASGGARLPQRGDVLRLLAR